MMEQGALGNAPFFVCELFVTFVVVRSVFCIFSYLGKWEGGLPFFFIIFADTNDVLIFYV